MSKQHLHPSLNLLLFPFCLFYILLSVIFGTGKIVASFEVLCVLSLALHTYQDKGRTLFRAIKTPTSAALFLYILYFILSTTWSPNPIHHGAWNFIRLSIYSYLCFCIVAIICVKADIKHQKRLAFFIVITAIASALYAIIKFYFYDGHEISERLEMTGRISHTLHGLYYYSLSVSICALAIIQRKKKIIPAIVIIFSCFFMTQSRGPLLAAIATLISITYIASPKSRRKFLLPAVSLSCIILLGIVAATWGEDRGTSKRLIIWKSAFEKIAHHPIIGTGNDLLNIVYRDSSESVHAHNIWISHLYWGGIIGLLLFVVCQYIITKTFILNKNNSLGLIGFGMMIFSFVALTTYGNVVISNPSDIWFLLIIPAGISAALQATTRD